MDTGLAVLEPDPERPAAYTLRIDGVPHSHVDLEDPTWLAFEYMRLMADFLECTALPRQRLEVLHLGGGAWSLARYLAATQPGSRQLVVDHDRALLDFVAAELPTGRGRRIRLRAGDARAVVAASAADSVDVVLTDVFAGTQVPAQLATVEFLAGVARILRPGGLHVMNLADGKPLTTGRSMSVAFREVFAQAALAADPGILRGRRWGNLVLAGWTGDAGPDPVALGRRCAGGAVPARLLLGDELVRFGSGYPAPRERSPLALPTPPANVLGLRGSR